MRFQTTIPTIAVVAVLWLLLSGCGSQPPSSSRAADVERIVVSPDQAKEAVLQVSQAALTLGVKLAAEAGNDAVVSPASALIALSMLREGASEEGAQEMDSVLGWGSDRQRGINAVLAELQKYDGDPASVDKANPPEKPAAKTSNGIFVQKSAPIGPGFLTVLAKHYGTGVYPVNFAGDAKDKINAWVKENIGGLIEKAPLESSADTKLSLLNALFFAARWQQPFNPESTLDAPFHAASWQLNVPMMHATQKLTYAEGPGWQAIDLPYGRCFVMRLYLPAAEGKPLPGAAQLAAVGSSLSSAQKQLIGLGLPSWDKMSNLDLMEPLRKIGLRKTFDDGGFDAILPGALIGGAAQTAVVNVAEKGTVAAALTQINVETSVDLVTETPRQLDFDRPFSYQIIQLETGLPLFLGVVDNPKA
ncbi:serpin (serine proteinase inhibitor) [Renibacterium salmoninarum ATCC 33209]|uniref:Serpin (Serine proteinase inhibitor) n=1 Tax=Renibacterium salmoninarum (strain ATCC 33209 / DSM 20767 / JCM 11484 / NBRC 15589 / NCIMB 2235) TaxID=288705 RepID=A9WLI2_RENSM|nr:serpin family protein [Renibacterium salmoninarum]ABY21942.1 serpin (serine proteinase inhibitor) [Renibacterium salmoninarum ATCC 33209]